MKTNQLNRVLNLVRNTGDRVVILDSDSDDILVVMPFADYESLLKPSTTFSHPASDYETTDFFSDNFSSKNISPFLDDLTEDDSNFEEKQFPRSAPLRKVPHRSKFSREAFVPASFGDFEDEVRDSEAEEWLSKEQKVGVQTEESLEDVPEEEEKFYLEPVDEV